MAYVYDSIKRGRPEAGISCALLQRVGEYMDDQDRGPNALRLSQSQELVIPGDRDEVINDIVNHLYLGYLGPEETHQYSSEVVREVLNKTPPGRRIIVPNLDIAHPIMSRLRMMRMKNQNPILRDLYLNLLRTSMDAETVALEHPAFAYILHQLSPDDARILKRLAEVLYYPALGVIASYGDREKEELTRNFSLIGIDAGITVPEMTTLFIGNLNRLGVTAVEDCTTLCRHPGEAEYDRLLKDPLLAKMQETYNKSIPAELREKQNIQYVRKHVRLTTLGLQLVEACVKEDV